MNQDQKNKKSYSIFVKNKINVILKNINRTMLNYKKNKFIIFGVKNEKSYTYNPLIKEAENVELGGWQVSILMRES